MNDAPYAASYRTGEDPWQARVGLSTGEVAGAGIVLDAQHVLTCAHVVPESRWPGGSDGPPKWGLVVDLVGRRTSERRPARVNPALWRPTSPGSLHIGEGDLAVLELEEPVTVVPAARLVQLSIRHGLSVRAYGFPVRAAGAAEWAVSKLIGDTGELVQIEAVHQRGGQVDHGFSGGGVVNADGQVVGMVVAKEAGNTGVALMMPVDTIVRYLPELERYVTGVPRTSPEMRSDGRASAEALSALRRITAELAGSDGVLLLVVDNDDARRAEVINLLAAATDPVTRDRVLRGSGAQSDGGVPPAGSVDVSFSVAGMTVAQVVAQIGRRLGLAAATPVELLDRLREGPAPLTAVLDAVDQAAEPGLLLDTLLRPLTGPGSGGRVVAGFRRDPGGPRDNVRILRLAEPGNGHPPRHPPNPDDEDEDNARARPVESDGEGNMPARPGEFGDGGDVRARPVGSGGDAVRGRPGGGGDVRARPVGAGDGGDVRGRPGASGGGEGGVRARPGGPGGGDAVRGRSGELGGGGDVRAWQDGSGGGDEVWVWGDGGGGGTVGEWLRRLEAQVGELRRAEAAGGGGTPVSDRLRMRLELLRARADGPELRKYLAATERVAYKALLRARAARTAAGRDVRAHLRGHLDVLRAQAADHGLAEDGELSAGYARALAAVRATPFDLSAAGAAVDAYQRVLWRRIGLAPTEDGR